MRRVAIIGGGPAGLMAAEALAAAQSNFPNAPVDRLEVAIFDAMPCHAVGRAKVPDRWQRWHEYHPQRSVE